MAFTITFVYIFCWAVVLIAPILLMMTAVIILLGQFAGRMEGWGKFDAFYWTLITASTVGYGDIRPLTPSAKLLSIVIAFMGLMFTGILVAVTLNATSVAFNQHIPDDVIDKIKQEMSQSALLSQG